MFWRFNAFGICWSLLVILVSVVPGNALPGLSLGYIPLDLFIHFILYWLLSLLVVVGLLKQNNYLFLKLNAVPIAIAYANTLGFSMEIFQIFINGRHFDLSDLTANLVGSMIGIVTYYILYKW
jgi:VanZ family protein